MDVVGVDGFKDRWVAIVLRDGRFHAAAVLGRLEECFDVGPRPAAVGVDIPIGLPELGARPADLAARAFVGVRRSSVFMTAPRAVLEAAGYAEAVALCVELTGKALSRQSYGLRTKILEADALRSRRELIEVHPEVSFRAMAGGALSHSKKSWTGLARRLELLAKEGIEIPADLGSAGLAAPDDVLDAAAVAWTAHRYASAIACALPDPPPADANGRPVAIWY